MPRIYILLASFYGMYLYVFLMTLAINFCLIIIAALYFEGWAQDCSSTNIFLKPLFLGNFDPFVNNANLGAIAHTSNDT